MVDNRTMEELLQAPTEGYGEATVIPEFNADHFKIKTNLLQLVQANPFHGFERENPHTHINNFRRITSTLKFRDVPNDVIKLMMFPYSLEGAARVWYDKEPPNSILTWDDLVNKFMNQFSHPRRPATSRMKSYDLLKNSRRHLERHENDLQKCLEHGSLIKQEDNLRKNLNDDMRSILGSFFQNQASTSGTLSSNTIPNLKGEMKAITTRSGVAYEGHSFPTNPSPKKRLNDQKLCENATNQMEKFFQIFQDFHFDISFVDALLLMPKFASTIKSLLENKDKLFELAKIPLNENCSTMLLKKLYEKLGDPKKKLYHKLSLPELTPTRMTLELADRSITRPKGVAEDVFVKVGKFHCPTDFVVIDFEADPRVPLILGRSFLRFGRALIDVYEEEITLRINDKAVTFNLNQTTRYSSTYDDMSVNRIDVIDVASEVLGFSKNSSGGNPTSTSEPIISNSFPSLTPFDGSNFILEEIEAYLKDDSQEEVAKAKSSIEEPPELELKDLPSHLEYAYLEGIDKLPVIIAKGLKDDEKEALLKVELKDLPPYLEYAFLEGDDKLPAIIAKDLSDEEKIALITVLKSHKRAIAWKLSDIKDDPTSPEVDQSYFDLEGDILLFKALLNDDPSLPPPNQGNYLP
nr:reverse transcriptase domain-containing protein [Tanacetum cinerariifolium]